MNIHDFLLIKKGPSQKTEACRLLELVKAGTLFLLPTIPESDVTPLQNAQANAFMNVYAICAGEKA